MSIDLISLSESVRWIEADYSRSADTHLIRVDLPRFLGITLDLKDESSHPAPAPAGGQSAGFTLNNGKTEHLFNRDTGPCRDAIS